MASEGEKEITLRNVATQTCGCLRQTGGGTWWWYNPTERREEAVSEHREEV